MFSCQTGASTAGGTDGTVNNGAEEIAFFSCADVNAFEVTEVWSGAFEVTDVWSVNGEVHTVSPPAG